MNTEAEELKSKIGKLYGTHNTYVLICKIIDAQFSKQQEWLKYDLDNEPKEVEGYYFVKLKDGKVCVDYWHPELGQGEIQWNWNSGWRNVVAYMPIVLPV